MSAAREEFSTLRRLAAPVIIGQVGVMLMGTVDTIMVGRVGVDALASAAMGNAWIYGTLLVAQGLVFGIDPLVTQAHGAGRGDLAGRALQRGLVIAGLTCLPLAILWAFTFDILVAVGQQPDLAHEAHRYTVVQIGSIPCFLGFAALRQYLQGREIVRPAMWVTGIANVFNAVANYALIFGNLGAPELGVYGAGIATGLTRVFMFLALVALVIYLDLHKEAWLPWSREVLSWKEMRRILGVGIPVAAQQAAEIWAFSGATLLSGLLDAAAVNAHVIVLNMAALSFMVPLGLAQASVIRVGNLLGAEKPEEAQRSAWVALGMAAMVMGTAAVVFITLRNWLPAIYTQDAHAIALAASIMPIAGAFQIFDGIQVVGTGILRGMGRTRPAVWFNVLGYWVIGLPIGGYLALRTDWGLAGLWWGLCLGLGIVAVSLVAWIRTRGPAREQARFV